MDAKVAQITTTKRTSGKSSMDTIDISVVLYQEGDSWIAQCLEYDITAQAYSLPELHEKLAMKLATEVSISVDLGIEPLNNVSPAPEPFWQMFNEAKMTVSAEAPPIRITDGARIPRVNPRMKVGQPAAA